MKRRHWLWFVCVRPKVERHNKCEFGVCSTPSLPDLCTIFRNYILHTFQHLFCFSLVCHCCPDSTWIEFPMEQIIPKPLCDGDAYEPVTCVRMEIVNEMQTISTTTTRKSQTAVGFSVLPSNARKTISFEFKMKSFRFYFVSSRPFSICAGCVCACVCGWVALSVLFVFCAVLYRIKWKSE